jgi:hypothetical protein
VRPFLESGGGFDALASVDVEVLQVKGA